MAAMIKREYNSRSNIVKIRTLGDENEFEGIVAAGTVSPGCIVRPMPGTPSEMVGISDANASYGPPTAALGGLPFYVVQTSSANGRALVSEWGAGEQVPLMAARSGDIYNVRVANGAEITAGTMLAPSTTGNGFVIASDTNPIGRATHDTVITDAAWPTFIEMEVF